MKKARRVTVPIEEEGGGSRGFVVSGKERSVAIGGSEPEALRGPKRRVILDLKHKMLGEPFLSVCPGGASRFGDYASGHQIE